MLYELTERMMTNVWIVLNDAYVSCVQDERDPNKIWVRGRAEGDVTRALRGVDGAGREVKSEPGRDYAYRACVNREQLKEALARNVDRIDYTNFKNSVREDDRHDAYADIWGVMYKFQRRRAK